MGDYDFIFLYNNRYTHAHVLARTGKLPKVSKHWPGWYYRDILGWIVAHEAATFGNLSEDYDDWTPMDGDYCETVAKTAARNGKLPRSFGDWAMTDENDTLSHERGNSINNISRTGYNEFI